MTNSSDNRSLLDRMQNPPEAWMHEENDGLIGRVLDRASNDNGYGPYSMLTILTEKGSTENGGKAIPAGSERTWHAFGTVPEREIERLDPRMNDRLAVKFLGAKPLKGGDGTFKAYHIVIEKQSHPEPPAEADPVDLPELPASGTPTQEELEAIFEEDGLAKSDKRREKFREPGAAARL